MSLKENLSDFAGALTTATLHAPDAYPSWSSWTYESHMADLKELWAKIHPQLKRNMEQADFINAKLQEAFAAFEGSEKDKGRTAIWAIYNLGVKQLR